MPFTKHVRGAEKGIKIENQIKNLGQIWLETYKVEARIQFKFMTSKRA